jgi:hypothetical protein
MKKIAAGAALVLATFGAHAADASKPFHFIIGAGLTGGGETLLSVTYTDGHTEKIRSGGLVAIHAGGEYRFNETTSLQAVFGYHIDDSSSADNGSVRFSRYPLEFLGHYQVADQWRLGGGLRVVTNAKLKGTGVASNVDAKFDNATGVVLEAEYFTSRSFGVKIRGVSERYKLAGGGYSASGNHFGLYGNFYF